MILILQFGRTLWRLGIPTFCALVLVSTGCAGFHGFHVHQPEDLENAKSAQTHFQKAALSKTVEAERKRLATVLKEELDLVSRHTLARRNARLLFIIGEGDTEDAWTFLKEDINKRIEGDFGLKIEDFEKTVTDLAMRKVRLEAVLVKLDRWKPLRAKNPKLPAISCSIKKGPPPQPEESMKVEDKAIYNQFRKACKKYIEVANINVGMKRLIDAVETAQREISMLIKKSQEEYNAARNDYASALKKEDSDLISAKAIEFRSKFENVLTLPEMLNNVEELEKAKTLLEPYGFGGIIEDLKSEATIASLAVAREKVIAILSAVAEAETSIKPEAETPETTEDIIGVLATVGKALQIAENQLPISQLQIQAEQLRLNLVAAQRRKAFFDKTMNLLKEKREARIEEIIYLARVEQLRRQVSLTEQNGCLKKHRKSFEKTSKWNEKCREKIFKLLAAYSNAWTFGRVRNEQLDYQLIALHHEAALDTSEVAFAKWDNLLNVPINQLVSLHGTGIRREDIRTLVQALGFIGVTAAVGAN